MQQATIYNDLNSLDAIRKQGFSDEEGAIKKAAQEFEAFFLKMMLKSMRQASEVIGEDNMMSSKQEKMFTGMMDDQLAVDLSTKGSLGIADLMVEQLVNAKNRNSAPSQIQNFVANKQHTFSQKSRQDHSVLAANNIPNLQPNKNIKDNAIQQSNLNVKADINAEIKPNKSQQLPAKKSLFDSMQSFIQGLYPYAQQAASKLNLDPKVLIAQAALETGWGKFIMHDKQGEPGFNLFGIKSANGWEGDAIEIDTLEVENSIVKKVKAQFRKYQNFAESFEDYTRFLLNNNRYQKAVSMAENPESFVKELQSAGYATDPNYAAKIMRIFSNEMLQKFDLGK